MFDDLRALFISCTLKRLQDAGGFPRGGNSRRAWDAGSRFDFENPEHRS